MADQYEITEKDIESTVNYLKASCHRLAMTNPDALDELYETFQKSRSESNPTDLSRKSD